jgi:hypothetical protein
MDRKTDDNWKIFIATARAKTYKGNSVANFWSFVGKDNTNRKSIIIIIIGIIPNIDI